MEHSNEFPAKGLVFLVNKMANKKSVARNYGPAFLADTLRDSAMTFRGSGEVSFHLFRLCLV